jgi:hypothetical protein
MGACIKKKIIEIVLRQGHLIQLEKFSLESSYCHDGAVITILDGTTVDEFEPYWIFLV